MPRTGFCHVQVEYLPIIFEGVRARAALVGAAASLRNSRPVLASTPTKFFMHHRAETPSTPCQSIQTFPFLFCTCRPFWHCLLNSPLLDSRRPLEPDARAPMLSCQGERLSGASVLLAYDLVQELSAVLQPHGTQLTQILTCLWRQRACMSK